MRAVTKLGEPNQNLLAELLIFIALVRQFHRLLEQALKTLWVSLLGILRMASARSGNVRHVVRRVSLRVIAQLVMDVWR